MQTIVYAQAAQHDTAVRGWRSPASARIERVARWATSLAVGVGAILILLFSRLRRQSTKAHHAQSDLNAHQATHDELTGLPNRALFAALLESALAEARETDGTVAVVLLDLDRFKEINDTLGHRFGDYLLQQIGPRISGVLRDVDVLARLGGDEFVLLFPSTATGQRAIHAASDLTRRILDALHEPFVVDDVSLAVEASAGIAVWPAHGATGDVLLQHADIAMYLAKTRHEDVALYNSALDGHNPRKLTLLSQLRDASDNGELELYLPTAGRHLQWWQSSGPRRSSGGITRTRDCCCRANSCRSPKAAGSSTSSPASCCSPPASKPRSGKPPGCRSWSRSTSLRAVCSTPGCRSRSRRRCWRRDCRRTCSKLELTETAIIADADRARSIIGRLNTLGVGLSIDDFGTGYTSLSFLRDLPLQEIKIDRSFVTNMLTRPKDAIIVRTGVELANRLGLDSVAEGIEDAATLDALATLGCTTAQGYHLGRPMPIDDFDSWLLDWDLSHPAPGAGAQRPFLQPLDTTALGVG